MNLLGAFDLMLAYGAIRTGVNMVLGKGIFSEYPPEWLLKVPFQNWMMPGIIAIGGFGLINMIAAMVSFSKKGNKPWLMSAITGCIFFISLIAQVVILEEVYLATSQFFLLSIIQLLLSRYAFLGYRKDLLANKI